MKKTNKIIFVLSGILIMTLSIPAFGSLKPCNGKPGRLHPNGGGFVADTAHVALTAYVDKEAQVCDNAFVGSCADIRENAKVYGNAKVLGCVWVGGEAEVYGSAVVSNSGVSDAYTSTIKEGAKVYGNAVIGASVSLEGNVQVFGHSVLYGDINNWVILTDGKINSQYSRY